ncbi:serine/threonine protein kinase [Haladaptatus sp. W1]|nr:serine/threonine protein kinase [Haladaptatus sp. W1]
MDLDGTMYHTEPVVGDDVLYLAVTANNTPGERAGYLGAYDIETGDRRWKRTGFPNPKTPTTSGEMLYFATQTAETEESDHGFYALDADSGETMWTRRDHSRWSRPILVGDRVFTANEEDIYALDAETGDTLWQTEGVTGIEEEVGTTLSYTDGSVFTSSGIALDADDGSKQWEVSPDDTTLGNPATNGWMVFFTQTDFLEGDDTQVTIEARSPDSGELQWEYESDAGNRWDGRTAITGDHVLLVDLNGESVVQALDAETGETAWETTFPGQFFSSPVVGGGIIYVCGQYIPESDSAAGRGLVHAVDSATGERQWSYLLDSDGLETSPEDAPAAGVPVISNGKLYAATYPANATLDYKYTYYSNFFVLGSCDRRPDGDERLPSDDPDGGDDFPPLDVCIDVVSNLDLDSLDVGDIVRLAASCSTGRELEFAWDIDGDGQYEESGSVVSATIPTCGSLTVELKVTDANGATDTASVRLSTN